MHDEGTATPAPAVPRPRVLPPRPAVRQDSDDDRDDDLIRPRHRGRWVLAVLAAAVVAAAAYNFSGKRGHAEPAGVPAVSSRLGAAAAAPSANQPQPLAQPQPPPAPPAASPSPSPQTESEPGLEAVPLNIAPEHEPRRDHHDTNRAAVHAPPPRGAARASLPIVSPRPVAPPVTAPASPPPSPPARPAATTTVPAATAPAAASPTSSAPSSVAPDDHYGLAREYLRDKKVEPAITELKKAIAANPRDSRAYWLLGMAYNLAGSDKSAVEAFERFVQLDPGHKDAAKARATIADYYKRHPR